jgi:hypothetical protein
VAELAMKVSLPVDFEWSRRLTAGRDRAGQTRFLVCFMRKSWSLTAAQTWQQDC